MSSITSPNQTRRYPTEGVGTEKQDPKDLERVQRKTEQITTERVASAVIQRRQDDLSCSVTSTETSHSSFSHVRRAELTLPTNISCQEKENQRLDEYTLDDSLLKYTHEKTIDIHALAVGADHRQIKLEMISSIISKDYDSLIRLVIKDLLFSKRLIQEKWIDGKLSLLNFAILRGSKTAVQILLDFGDLVLKSTSKTSPANLPIHYAYQAYYFSQKNNQPQQMLIYGEIIKLLVASGSEIDPLDESHKRPCGLLVQSLIKEARASGQVVSAPENLVFCGGGAKGLAYVGVLESLEKKNLLSGVKTCVGTSGGAITASLLSIGYTAKELREVFVKTNLIDFIKIKDQYKQLKIEEAFGGNLAPVIEQMKGEYLYQPWKWFSLFEKVQGFKGFCDGECFLGWIKELIRKKTGKENFTFKDLREKVEKKANGYKHFICCASQVESNQNLCQPIYFDSRSVEHENILLADAIRASMSIPAVFDPYEIPGFGTFMDGGMVANYPIGLFDSPSTGKVNTQTLGFRFKQKSEQTGNSPQSQGSLGMLSSIILLYASAEDLIASQKPFNQQRTIEIDPGEIGTLSFYMNETQKADLINAGSQAVNNRFDGEAIILQKPKLFSSLPKDMQSSESVLRQKYLNGQNPTLPALSQQGLVFLKNIFLAKKMQKGKSQNFALKSPVLDIGAILLNHAPYLWAEGKLWKEAFDAIYFLNGEHVSDEADLKTAIAKYCYNDINYPFELNSKKLIIFCGYEHLSAQLRNQLQKDVENRPTSFIVTSKIDPSSIFVFPHQVKISGEVYQDDLNLIEFKTEDWINIGACGSMTRNLIEIIQRKEELTEKRRKEGGFKEYPKYLDKLLDGGYLDLYDHLLDMKKIEKFDAAHTKAKEIEGYSFSKISRIILETQTCVFDEVISKISPDIDSVVFLLGNTGSGKSTTLCFLRGDAMELDSVSHGYSSQNSTDKLIGHSKDSSCTFLPTVEIVGDLALVDFAGFGDTNGALVSLGMEIGLKRLTERYPSKILVIEDIEKGLKRGTGLDVLGRNLKRLLGEESLKQQKKDENPSSTKINNEESVVIGITKYAGNVNFKEILAIEEKQREELNKPSEEEKKLEWKLEELSKKFNKTIQKNDQKKVDKIQGKIRKTQEELDILKKRRRDESIGKLPETKEKTEHLRVLKEGEENLSNQIGIQKRIFFSDLKNSEKRKECLAFLSSLKKSHWSTQGKLDDTHKALLSSRLTEDEDLKKKILDIKGVGDFGKFERLVFESSLTKTLLAYSDSNTEVGELLHLPGIDPDIVRQFDEQIVVDCIKKVIDRFVLNIEFEGIEKALTKFGDQSPEKQKALKETSIRIKKYILGLKGIKAETEQEVDTEWKKLRIETRQKMSEEELNDIDKRIKEIEKAYELTVIWKVLYAIPFGIPRWIHDSAKQEAIKKEVNNTFDRYFAYFDGILSDFMRLKGIEKLVQKRKEIDEKIKNFIPDFDSLKSLDRSLHAQSDQVGAIYGPQEWESRVKFLGERLERVDQDLMPLLYLGCDPSFEVIKIKGNIKRSRNLLISTGIGEENALLFEKQESGLTIVLKKHSAQDEKWNLFSETFKEEHQEFFKAGHYVETINMQAKVSVRGSEKPVSYPVRDTLAKVVKDLGVEINNPLSQMLLSAAVRSKGPVEKSLFLEQGVVEKSIRLIQPRFGKAKWEEYFGDVGVEPSLPSNIKEILNRSCPFWPDKKVKETHLLVLIPETVNGKPFHLDSLSELIQSPKTGFKTQYKWYNSDVKKELGTKSLASHWVLMTKDVIPGSRRETYKAQKALVQKHAQENSIPYELPKALEAATVILMHHVETGQRIYSDSPLTYTRCQENVDNNQWPAAIGGFAAGGLGVHSYPLHDDEVYGVGGCLKVPH